MQKYSQHQRCDKCGSTEHSLLYRHSNSDTTLKDYLKVTCSKCHYSWNNLPVDRKDTQSGL